MRYVLLALLLLSHTAYATQVVKKSLPELVADSDHVVIGTEGMKVIRREAIHQDEP